METQIKTVSEIKKKMISRVILFFVFFGICFFLPARTFKYWEAWVYIGIVFCCATLVIRYFLKHDPEFLERRMKTREKVKEQKVIIRMGWLLFLPIFIIPGFEKYYGWSNIPIYLILTADFLVLLGYLIVFRVFIENSYASRVVEVVSDQKVISTGPYAIVRHPMYSGILLMYGLTPLALGSYYAFICSFFLVLIIIFRIYSEEKFLSENLAGYNGYLKTVRYRIIPGIW